MNRGHPCHYPGPFLYLKFPETPFYKGILTGLLFLVSVTAGNVNVGEIAVW